MATRLFIRPGAFRFRANDGGIPPSGGASNIATVTVNIMKTVYSADMDAEPGWTLDAGKGSSVWQWGVPTGGGGQYGNPDPTSGYSGSNVMGYNLTGDYANRISQTQWATTPPLDCSGFSKVYLKFYRWLNVEQASYDHAYIEVSNNGNDWSRIWENTSEVTDSDWLLQSFDISSIARGQSTVFIRWGMGPTDNTRKYSGWNIDDVEVSGAEVGIAGDFQLDCDVDLYDFAVLGAAWLSRAGDENWCPGCDISEPNDNIINMLDLDVFTEDWLKGQ